MITTLIQGLRGRAAKPTAAARKAAMSLEDRKRWREAMAYRSVRDTMLKLEQLASQYRLRLFPIDERHHRFVAIMDVAQKFRPVYQGKRLSLTAAEALVQEHAKSMFGVHIDAVYWREHTGVSTFADAPARAGDGAGAAQRRDPDQLSGSRAAFSEPDQQEITQFRAALRQGQKPSPLVIAGSTYETEFAGL